MVRVIDMASGEIEIGDELVVSVTSDECRQWSAQIGEQLEEMKETKEDVQYRAAFMCAFLLQRFADELDAGAIEVDIDVSEFN